MQYEQSYIQIDQLDSYGDCQNVAAITYTDHHMHSRPCVVVATSFNLHMHLMDFMESYIPPKCSKLCRAPRPYSACMHMGCMISRMKLLTYPACVYIHCYLCIIYIHVHACIFTQLVYAMQYDILCNFMLSIIILGFMSSASLPIIYSYLAHSHACTVHNNYVALFYMHLHMYVGDCVLILSTAKWKTCMIIVCASS